ncbi:MAG: hypothetical protein UH625_07160, partial [Muribaculaceae bacterium]|nr:hypothetical protein [Muribaculaceae bacterium]
MTDFESLRLKVEDLKMKIEYKSITPVYLGSLLEDILEKMEDIDMTGMNEPIRDALASARKAITLANDALLNSNASAALSSEAKQSAETALQQSATAIANAQAAKVLSESTSAKLAAAEVVHSVEVTQTPGTVTIDVATGPLDGEQHVLKVRMPEANGYEPGLMSLNHQKALNDNTNDVRNLKTSVEALSETSESQGLAVEQLQQDMIDYTDALWNHIGEAEKKMMGYITCDYVVDKVDCVVIESEATADDVAMSHVVWDRSRRAFVLVSHDASFPHCSGGDCWLKWEGKGDYALKNFSKYILTCGDKCHHFVDGDWQEIATSDELKELMSKAVKVNGQEAIDQMVADGEIEAGRLYFSEDEDYNPVNGGTPFYNFGVEIQDGKLTLKGIRRLEEAGYVPYVFRRIMKKTHSRRPDSVRSRRKGWQVYLSWKHFRIGMGHVLEINAKKGFGSKDLGWLRSDEWLSDAVDFLTLAEKTKENEKGEQVTYRVVKWGGKSKKYD